MLDNGFKYVDQITEKEMNCWYDDRYLYYFWEAHEPFALPAEYGDWNKQVFVSLDRRGEVIGSICYKVNRSARKAYDLTVINYSVKPEDKVTFGLDLYKAIDHIFTKFNFNKLEFSMHVGNPLEPWYDKIVARIGGCIVGVWREFERLANGQLVDLKLYEIMRDDYLQRTERKRGHKE